MTEKQKEELFTVLENHKDIPFLEFLFAELTSCVDKFLYDKEKECYEKHLLKRFDSTKKHFGYRDIFIVGHPEYEKTLLKSHSPTHCTFCHKKINKGDDYRNYFGIITCAECNKIGNRDIFKDRPFIKQQDHTHCSFCQRQLIIDKDEIYQIDVDTALCGYCNAKRDNLYKSLQYSWVDNEKKL
jgi:hypothetical protein